MGAKIRFAVGFGVGLVVTVPVVPLAGAGHGTYAPLIAATSLLMFIPGVGVYIAFFGAPFLWGIYFAAIPAIESRFKRIAILAAILLLHLGPALWGSEQELASQLQDNPAFMVIDGVVICGAFILLTLVIVSGKPKAEVNR